MKSKEDSFDKTLEVFFVRPMAEKSFPWLIDNMFINFGYNVIMIGLFIWWRKSVANWVQARRDIQQTKESPEFIKCKYHDD